MWGTFVIGTEPEVAEGLARLVQESGEFSLLATLERYPEPHELQRLLNTRGPEVILLELSDPGVAVRIVDQVAASGLGTVLIGFGGDASPGAPPIAVHGHLRSPITAEQTVRVTLEAIRVQRHAIHPNLVAILPGKAGSGATMTAVNVAGILVQYWDRKVLLIDGDLRSGVLATIANVEPSCFLQDALARSGELTRVNIAEYVSTWEGVDILPTNRDGSRRPEWRNYFELLEVATRAYTQVLVDLPEVVNDATAEIVTRAHRVVVVCTPELPSLELARQRLAELEEAGVEESRVRIVLNRWNGKGLPEEDIEQALGAPVWAKLRNGYAAMQQVILSSKPVSPEAELFDDIWRLAAALFDLEGKARPKARMLDKAKSGFAGLFRG